MRTRRMQQRISAPVVIATTYVVAALAARVVFAANEKALMMSGAILSALAVLSLLSLLIRGVKSDEEVSTQRTSAQTRGDESVEQTPVELNKLLERLAQLEHSLQAQIQPIGDEATAAKQSLADLRVVLATMDRNSTRLQVWGVIAGIAGGFLLSCSSLLPLFSH